MVPAVQLNEIRKRLERQPFRPFRICVSDGTEHIVSNPNFIFLTRHTLYIGIPEDAEDLPEDTKLYDTMHITRVEPVGEGPSS